MSFLQTFRIQDPESSGFRILKSSKMFYLQIFRIQDPESSGSKDPAGKSQEGRIYYLSFHIAGSLQTPIFDLPGAPILIGVLVS
jgi:hypothetical protein